LGIFHSNEKDSVMTPCFKHGFSPDYKHEILDGSNNALIQQMYGKPKSVEVRTEVKAVFISKKAKSW